MTRCQPRASAKAPCTRTIVGFGWAALFAAGAPALLFAGAGEDWAAAGEPLATRARTRAANVSRKTETCLMANSFLIAANAGGPSLHLSDLNVARRSSTRSFGCSQAAK